jgi:hypothetical protein
MGYQAERQAPLCLVAHKMIRNLAPLVLKKEYDILRIAKLTLWSGSYDHYS